MLDSEFNLEKFLHPGRYEFSSPEFEYVQKVGEKGLREKIIIGSLADPGSGVEYAFQKFSKQWPEQVFILDCGVKDVNTIYGDLMSKMPFNSKIVNWYKTPYLKMVEAIAYYLHEINNRTVFIFNNCDALSVDKFVELLNSFALLKGKVGILYRLSKKRGIKYQKTTNMTLRNSLLQTQDWAEFELPSPEHFSVFCDQAGILSPRIIKDLTKDNPGFDLLQFRINALRIEYLKKNK